MMIALVHLLGMYVADLFNSRRRLEVENLFLRHQLNIVLRRTHRNVSGCGVVTAPCWYG
jgi:hypothetical protein